jgi:hypothetical protein
MIEVKLTIRGNILELFEWCMENCQGTWYSSFHEEAQKTNLSVHDMVKFLYPFSWGRRNPTPRSDGTIGWTNDDDDIYEYFYFGDELEALMFKLKA